jgi:hypothetical protein
MTETTAATAGETSHEPVAEGALAETTETYEHHVAGTRFTVEEYVPAPTPGEPEHGDPQFWQEPFYYGSNRGGLNNVMVPARIVQVVPKENRLALSDIVSDLSSTIHGGDLGINETQIDGDRIHVYGSHKGMQFQFTLAIEDLELS